MGNNNKENIKSRRWFLSDKAALDAASTQKKASNKEIYDWMKNPSKENNS